MSRVRQTVLSSLSAVGARQEARFYADLFAKAEPERFALILLDPRVLKNPLLEALTSNLQILSNLGLAPILLIGALDTNRTSIKFQAQRLARDLEGSGVKVAKLNTATYGLIAEIRKRTQGGIIPILEMEERRGAASLPKLINELRPNKIVSLQPSGGLDEHGERRRNLRFSEIEDFLEAGRVSPGQQTFLRMVHRIEQDANEGRRTYVLASPLNLLSELFTTRGSGTLIRRGVAIVRHDALDGLNRDRLNEAMSRAFDKPLKPDALERPMRCAFLEPEFRAGAVLHDLAGQAYLSKFWVVPEAQGEGLSRDVWERLVEDFPSLFWRSRADNSFNEWYMRVCDGMQVKDDWRIFWRRIDTGDLPAIIEAATQAPVDFE